MWATGSGISFNDLYSLSKELLTKKDELLLIWEEHCTECFVPLCYHTCALYVNRYDGKCERFVDGIQLNLDRDKKLTFKRWAKLETKFNVKLRGRLLNIAVLYVYYLTRNFLFLFPKHSIRSRCFGLINAIIYKIYDLFPIRETKESFELLFKFKSDIQIRNFQIEIVNQKGEVFFKDRIKIYPLTETLEISTPKLKISKGFVRITVDEDANYTFIFKDIEMRLLEQTSEINKKIVGTDEFVKIVFWDLDNTVWNGVLIEGAVFLRHEIRDLIIHLNSLGIVNAVISKNNFENAEERLKELELFDLFIGYQINWNPKSENILNLLRVLNLRAANAVFVDDSKFEREEVKSNIPQIKVYDENQILSVQSLSDFNPPQSSESQNRISSYRAILQRENDFVEQQTDYAVFLLKSNVTLVIEDLNELEWNRAFELLSRSNQLNFSGKKYSWDQFKDSAKTGKWFFGKVSDRYGDYGKTILAKIESSGDQITITDLTISCRIAKRNIEAAFFRFLFESMHIKKISCLFVCSEKNQMLQQVLSDLQINFQNQNCDLQILDIYDSEVLSEHAKVVKVVF